MSNADEPMLGLATTRQLLEELQARGLPLTDGALYKQATNLLHILGSKTLDYRTVDSDDF